MDVLFPTQDQIAVMSLAAGRLRTAGLATAVPDFAALAQVLRPGCGGTGGRAGNVTAEIDTFYGVSAGSAQAAWECGDMRLRGHRTSLVPGLSG